MSQVSLVEWVQSGSHCVPSQWEAAACLAMQEKAAKQALCSLLVSPTHKHLPQITWNMTVHHWDHVHLCAECESERACAEQMGEKRERERRWMCLNVSLIVSPSLTVPVCLCLSLYDLCSEADGPLSRSHSTFSLLALFDQTDAEKGLG